MSLAYKIPNYLLILIMGYGLIPASQALDLEPRRWSHLPVDINFLGAAYVYTDADIAFDPVLELKDVDMELHSWLAKYIRTFELFNKSARIELTQGYQDAKWRGFLSGLPTSAQAQGLTDSFVRVAMNLYGAPPLKGEDFAAYRATKTIGTIVGVGLVTRLPTGNYKKDELLNLGANRFTIRPQIGVSHFNGNWTAELGGEVVFFGENDDFVESNKLEQDPLYVLHGHLIYTFRPGLWLGASLGYDYGGEKKINGVKKNDKKEHYGWSVNLAYPINRVLGVKLAYLNIRDQKTTGINADTFVASLAYMW